MTRKPFGFGVSPNAIVYMVEQGSAARRAGVRRNSKITHIAGKKADKQWVSRFGATNLPFYIVLRQLKEYTITVGARPFGVQFERNYITDVAKGSPAHNLGATKGMVITKIDGKTASDKSWFKMFEQAKLPFQLAVVAERAPKPAARKSTGGTQHKPLPPSDPRPQTPKASERSRGVGQPKKAARGNPPKKPAPKLSDNWKDTESPKVKVKVGNVVIIKEMGRAVVKYVGVPDFTKRSRKDGYELVGAELLDHPDMGENNGKGPDGKRYFRLDSRQRAGVFVRHSDVEFITHARAPSECRSSTSSGMTDPYAGQDVSRVKTKALLFDDALSMRKLKLDDRKSHHETHSGMLRVAVICAIQLNGYGSYCYAKLGSHALQTHYVDKSDNPSWDQTLTWKGFRPGTNQFLTLSVYEYNVILPDTCIGSVEYRLPRSFEHLQKGVCELTDSSGNISGLLIVHSLCTRKSDPTSQRRLQSPNRRTKPRAGKPRGGGKGSKPKRNLADARREKKRQANKGRRRQGQSNS